MAMFGVDPPLVGDSSHRGRVLAVGGMSSQNVAIVEAFDPPRDATDESIGHWTQLTSMPRAMWVRGLLPLRSAVVAVGKFPKKYS